MAGITAGPTAPASTRLADHARHQVGIRLLPFLFILYIVNYIDRTNLAYAALGMSRDLGFSDRVFGLGAGIFFISYVALQVPGARLVEQWSARKMISATMITWGSLTMLTALVHTPGQLYLLRFFLGAAEAGFFPGVIVYLSHWFISEDRAKAISNFMGAIPLSSVLGSPLAGWILEQQWNGLQGWRWLFVIEGVPAIGLGVIAFFFLTDWPKDAHWLLPEQKQWFAQNLRQEAPTHTQISLAQALKSRIILSLSLSVFCCYLTYYCFVYWLPTILKRQSGFSDLRVGLFGALPFVAYFLALQLNGWHSDKSRERRWHTAIPLFLAAASLLALLAQLHSVPWLIAMFILVGAGGGYISPFWAVPTEILSPSSKATAVGVINAAGSVAGFAGPYAFGYLYARTGSLSAGLWLMLLAALAGGVMILRVDHTPQSGQRS